MQDRPEQMRADNPLRHLTTAQFMALGGNAVVYIRAIEGSALAALMDDVDEAAAGQEFQMVVAADGSPLLVADSEDAVAEWLADKDVGIVTLH